MLKLRKLPIQPHKSLYRVRVNKKTLRRKSRTGGASAGMPPPSTGPCSSLLTYLATRPPWTTRIATLHAPLPNSARASGSNTALQLAHVGIRNTRRADMRLEKVGVVFLAQQRRTQGERRIAAIVIVSSAVSCLEGPCLFNEHRLFSNGPKISTPVRGRLTAFFPRGRSTRGKAGPAHVGVEIERPPRSPLVRVRVISVCTLRGRHTLIATKNGKDKHLTRL